MTAARRASVAYVLKGFPVLSETFISSEVYRVERAGLPLRIFVVKPRDERETHPVIDRIEARPDYLPPTTRISDGSRVRWLLTNAPPFLPSLARTLRRKPRGVLAAARLSLTEAILTRRSFWAWPRLSYVRDLLLALSLADRVLNAPDVRHLHAHFAHDTATITWMASMITGVPFSFTAHAKDIYAERLNPRRLLDRKMSAAAFVVTCTEANRRHLARLANGTPVHRVYHGLNDDFRRWAATRPRPGAQTGSTTRLLAVGRLVRKKGFDVFVEACGVLHRRGVAFEAAIVGEDDDVGENFSVGDDLRRRIARLGLEGRVRMLGQIGQAELFAHYRTASVFCLACRVLDNGDRDGIPNVLLEAMACGLPVVTTPVSGIPELIEDGRNGLLIPEDDTEALAAAVQRLHADRELRAPAGVRRTSHRPRAVRRRTAGAQPGVDVRAGDRVMERTRSAPGVDSDRIAPRSVYCITRSVHSDRSVAEAVRAGRFTHAGVTLELGTEPDWLGADLPSDDEWRIEWTKFYYGLDLGNAFAATGDPSFLHAWERLVGSWIGTVPVGCDASDAAARRMQNWTYAWDLFASAPDFPGLRDGLDEALLDSIAAHVGHVRAELTPEVYRNHRTLELYALFVVALAFPALDAGSELLAFTIAELHRTLVEGFRADGVHREGSTHYHLVALRSLLGARENARRFSLTLPDGFDRLLERACEFALHCHRPDGIASALSDADAASYPEVLRLAGTLLGRPDFSYAATAGREGRPPAERSPSFPHAGYFFQRSGWGDGDEPYSDERFLVFDCGPLGDGGHGHYDLLSVEVYAYGRPLLVDPGRVHVRGGRREPAALVQGDRRPQHDLRGRFRSDAVPHGTSRGPGGHGDPPRPNERSRVRPTGGPRREPLLRRAPHAARGVRRRLVLDRRG